MKHFISKSKDAGIVGVKLANSRVMHRWVQHPNGMVDEVTGMVIENAPHSHLPLVDLQQLYRKMHVTFRLKEIVSGQYEELFRVGSDSGVSYRIEVNKQSSRYILLYVTIYIDGEFLTRMSLASSLVVGEPITVTLDLDQIWSGTNRYSGLSHSPITDTATRSSLNPFTIAEGFTTQHATYDVDILAVEEIHSTTVGVAHEVLSNYTPGYAPIAYQTPEEGERMVLNSYVEDGLLEFQGSVTVVSTGENKNGAFNLSGVQTVEVSGDLEPVNSFRFISYAEPSEHPWFTVERGGQAQDVFVDSEHWIVIDGQRINRILPKVLHTVWVISIYDQSYVFCNGLDSGGFTLPSGTLKVRVHSSAQRVTGLQAFNLDVRPRTLLLSNAATKRTPWWTVHGHLKPAYDDQAYYRCNSLLFGSNDSADPKFIGRLPASNSYTLAFNAAVCSAEVGIVIDGRIIGAGTAVRRVDFEIDGVKSSLGFIRRSNTRTDIYLRFGDTELFEPRATTPEGIDHSGLIAIRAVDDKLELVYSGDILAIKIPRRKVHSLGNIVAPSIGANTGFEARSILVYSADETSRDMAPPQILTSSPNVYRAARFEDTHFMLATRQPCELVGNSAYEAPWLFSGIAARSNHLEITPSETPVTIPADVQLESATLQLILGTVPTVGDTAEYVTLDFDTFKVKVYSTVLDVDDPALSVELGGSLLELSAADLGQLDHWYEILVRFTGTRVQLIHNAETKGEVSSLVTPNFEELQVTTTPQASVKVSALRIVEGTTLKAGRGFATPIPEEVVGESVSAFTLKDLHAETLRTRGNMLRRKQKNAVIEGSMLPSIVQKLPPPINHWPIFEQLQMDLSIVTKEALRPTPGGEIYISPVQAFTVEKREQEIPKTPEVHKRTTAFTVVEQLDAEEPLTPEVLKSTTTFVVVEKLPI